jgi:hypothetical protein
METEFQKAVGKGMGEVIRDITDFLCTPYVINRTRQIDLCSLVEDLNMHEQFSFALLSEAEAQGWGEDETEAFYRRACAPIVEPAVIESMLSAFRNRDGEAYQAYSRKYGNRFSALDGSYWSTAIALGIDADQVEDVMHYLRLFTVALMEFAYMEDRNPEVTYAWCYYESFRKTLDQLAEAPAPAPLAPKVRALGGSVGKREGEYYYLSLGVDVENPNPDRMARGVQIDITLKDKNGNVITVIGDRLESVDPGAVFHYGVTRKIRGAAIGNIAANVRASSYLKLSTPIMKHTKLSSLKLKRADGAMQLTGMLDSEYDKPLRSLRLHYQFLSSANKILGGGSEWLLSGISPAQPLEIASKIAVSIENVAKVVYSVDFDAVELVAD